MNRTPDSFACDCGAREELVAPTPATIDCWHCKLPLGMRRWTPLAAPPRGNARRCTAVEQARIAIA